MELAHIPHHKGEKGRGLAGHLTVTLQPVGDLASYRAKTTSDALPSIIPLSSETSTKLRVRNKTRTWTLWTLWFNTYKYVSLIVSSSRVSHCPVLVLSTRKLFTLVVTINAVGIVFAASGHFPYAEKWTGAMALGNLNCAILIRNELFGRFLYLFVNTCFAKVNISMF